MAEIPFLFSVKKHRSFPYICPSKKSTVPYFFLLLSEIQFNMKYRLDKQEQYAVLTLEEENLNSTFAPALKSDLILFNQEGVRNFILDLSQVKYVDSSGLSAILTGHRIWKDHGAFVIAGELQPMVNKLIEISRLQTILVMIPTVSEAVDYVMMEELERDLQGGEE
jgi:anti-anti-sigma factor